MTRSNRAARALAHLPETDPALASLALWCDTTDSPTHTSTERGVIHIGPEFEHLPLREQVGLLGHHILHAALRHEARMGAMATRLGPGFDPRRYNLAADAVVNEILDQGGHALPRPAVTLKGLLTKVLDMDPGQGLSEWDVDRLYMVLSDQSGPQGADRQSRYEDETGFAPDLTPGTEGGGREGAAGEDPAGDPWQGHRMRAMETPGASGRGIGQVLAHVADLPRSETPWELRLRRLLALATTQTPRRSHRRPRSAWIAAEAMARATGGPSPVFEPGQARDTLRPRIVVGIDSSGSITQTQLSLFTAELSGIARRTGAETHVLAFDDVVYACHHLRDQRWDAALANIEYRREGGTSFVDVLAQAEAMEPSIIVLLTDLEGHFGSAPAVPVLWATPNTHWPTPPFGDVLSLAR